MQIITKINKSMKKLISLLTRLCSPRVGSQSSDVSLYRRLTVGSPSGRYVSANSARTARRWLKSVAVFLFLFTLTIGQMRAGTYSFDLHTVASKSAGSNVSYWYSNSACTTHCKTVDGSSNKISSCTLYYKDATITTAKPFVISVANDAYWFTGSPSKFFIGKSGSTITLPTFSGEKITNVRITTGTQCSGKVTFCIMSGGNNASSTTSQTGAASTSFDFPITSTYQSTALTFTITNANNINITDIIITTEAAASCSVNPTIGNASLNGSFF